MARDDLFMLTVAEAITRSAIERKESRGAHWRTDFPDKSEEMGRLNLVVRLVDGCMEISRVPNPRPPEALQELIAA